MGFIIGVIVVIFFIYAIVSFTGEVGSAYQEGGCGGVLAFLFFAVALVVAVLVLGL